MMRYNLFTDPSTKFQAKIKTIFFKIHPYFKEIFKNHFKFLKAHNSNKIPLIFKSIPSESELEIINQHGNVIHLNALHAPNRNHLRNAFFHK